MERETLGITKASVCKYSQDLEYSMDRQRVKNNIMMITNRKLFWAIIIILFKTEGPDKKIINRMLHHSWPVFEGVTEVM